MGIREELRLNLRAGGVHSAMTVAVWRLGLLSRSTAGLSRFVIRLTHLILDQVWVKGVIGSDLPREVQLGERLFLAHGGRGVFVAPGTVIGSDCTIHQQVTIGETLGRAGAPIIKDRVYVGTKSSIFGPITVGSDTTIAAHAAVVRDVPPSSVARGVPARAYSKA